MNPDQANLLSVLAETPADPKGKQLNAALCALVLLDNSNASNEAALRMLRETQSPLLRVRSLAALKRNDFPEVDSKIIDYFMDGHDLEDKLSLAFFLHKFMYAMPQDVFWKLLSSFDKPVDTSLLFPVIAAFLDGKITLIREDGLPIQKDETILKCWEFSNRVKNEQSPVSMERIVYARLEKLIDEMP